MNPFLKIIPILFLIILGISLSGCVNLDQKTKINSDGSGTMKIKYWTKSSNVTSDELAGFGFTNRKVRVNYSSKYTEPTNIQIEKDLTSDSLYIVTLDVNFSDINKITDAIAFDKITTSWDNGNNGMNFKYTLLQDTANAKQLGMIDYKLTYEFDFPNEVLSSNGDINGRKVLWNFTVADLMEDIELTATIKAGN